MDDMYICPQVDLGIFITGGWGGLMMQLLSRGELEGCVPPLVHNTLQFFSI